MEPLMKGRFAPSPTGRLHLGNARSALLGWLQAKSAGGRFLLRIEDLDGSRVRPGFVDDLFRDLEYLGLHWDDVPLYQSRRFDVYRESLDVLASRGLTYPCFCSRAEIARAASAPHGPGDEGPVYPGTCRDLSAEQARERSASRPPAIRFRVPPGNLAFDDDVHGPVTQDVAQAVGDFVIQRNDGVASYQLAVVVDDADCGITHVLRADDLLGSTPRQLLLYRALQKKEPAFAHVPLILGADGKRLAKRDGPFSITDLRQAQVPAERVLGLLARWSGLSSGEPVRAQDLVSGFSLARIGKQPTVARDEEVHGLIR
jgi:glutamyl-tRNA synthetase